VRLVFLGTPDFAVPALDAVAREHEIVLVVAQPDKPSGRGMKMHAPPVALRARELGLPIAQPAKVRDPEFLGEVRKLAPDAGVVIAYGKILPGSLLAIPRHGFFNVHASVLPRYRGAAPIQRAIEAGDTMTGVTIMRVDEELDHGPMLAIETTDIGPEERTPSLARRLSEIGAAALLHALRDIEHGTAVETPQDHERATLAPKIDKAEGEIQLTEAAETIFNRFRAFDPWPGVFIQHGGEAIKLTDVRVEHASGLPRTVLALDDSITIATGDRALRILEMQRPGKPRTPAGVVARGLGWRVGDVV
jgi:methionyl-tRNA formyltransferase